MKNTNSLNLIICTILFTAFLSCNNDDDAPSSTIDQISDIAEFYGNLEGDIVVIHSQGGSGLELDDAETSNQIVAELGIQSAMYVMVHQVQTKTPMLFTDSDITFEQAKEYNLQSVSNIKRVVDFFNNQQGKTVYLLGISYGCLIVQELIATYGVDVADGYLILGNRLDMDDAAWQALSEGNFPYYTYDNDGNYTIEVENDPEFDIIEERNMGRLLAGLAFNRYTDRLSNVSSLSKVTYVYGDRDEVAGPLSAQEIQFLNDKGANVILSEGSGHDDAIGEGAGLLKEVFGIE
ncbi:hypothetical protein A8C32_15875 [Flavivirga aquatica]|uniref:AB hydrolase-1 domain-containing protein n=1 Tax=Flavivirga aquatica TaxID=1849968 RepID=A0A1E5T984_9FLAO|nr:alpha/beta hydrolase [Flavivirga aquatica]OEK07942.1 hypothetical protein A8C32_15875 [Flavivirga aquatica]